MKGLGSAASAGEIDKGKNKKYNLAMAATLLLKSRKSAQDATQKTLVWDFTVPS